MTPSSVEGYDHVIVPFDGTDEAQRAAVVGSGLAQVMGAELVLATVDELARPRERLVAKARAESLSDVAATVWLEPGRSAVAGLETMLTYRPNAFICMATHARTGILRTVYGSLGAQLLRSIDAPLLLLGPNCRHVDATKLHHLVVSIDRSGESDQAITLATRWAPLLAAGTTVVYTKAGEEIVVDIDQRIASLVTASRAIEKQVVERAEVAAALLGIVRQAEGSLIVVAAPHLSGLERFHQEAFIAKLCHDGPAPVLVQRSSA
jgi:nucleotide-binding universal stress UspA family protein